MAITFGSFGDIIAAIQAAHKLLEILSAGQGAKREYRDLSVNLKLFHGFLDHLLCFWQTRLQCPELDSLYDILQPAVLDAKSDIEVFLDKIVAKYGSRLLSPSKRNPLDVARMLQFGILEKENITRLQTKLRKAKEMILLVQSQANLVQEETNNDVVTEKMGLLMDAGADTLSKLEARLDDLQEKAEKQREMLNQLVADVSTINLAMSPLTDLASDLPDTLSKIYTEQLAQRALFSNLNPYAQNSVLAEDALGWTMPIPLELVASWNTLHSIMLDRFTNRPGLQLAKKHRYVFRDDLTGMVIQQTQPLRLVLRPGQKINMGMVFFASMEPTSTCPRCLKPNLQMGSTDLRCLSPGCNMEIQRVEEATDEEHLRKSITPVTAERSDDVQCYEANEDATAMRKILIQSCTPEDGPSVFKRIRYITRWEHRFDSRGRVEWQGDQYSTWMARGNEAQMITMCLARVLGNSIPIEWLLPMTWERSIYVWISFIGPTVKQSRLMIGVFSMKKRYRNEALKLLKEVEWVKNNSSIICVAHSGGFFREECYRTHLSKNS